MEELISTNEELQSANEELQTSKEELQSLNEELETVNTELRQKVDELGTANSDLQNLFASSEVATLFLDRNLRIARFTPAATELFHLLDADIGRPIGDFAPRFDGQDVVSDARDVLRSLRPIERQVQASGGKEWFFLRVLPYRTVENVIAGVVVTFVDITELKRAEEATRQSQALLTALSETVSDALFVKDIESRILLANPATLQVIGKPADQVLGKNDREIYDDRAVGEAILANDRRIMDSGVPEVVEERVQTPAGYRVFSSTKAPRRDANGRVIGLVGVARDITERKQFEEELRQAHARAAWLARFPEENPDPVMRVASDSTLSYANDAARSALGALGLEQNKPVPEAIAEGVRGALAEGRRLAREVRCGDRTYWLAFSPKGSEINVYGQDITPRKRAEEALRASEARLRLALDAARMVAWEYDPATLKVAFSENVEEVLELPSKLEDSDQGFGLIHPDDVERHRALVTEAIATGGGYVSVYRHAHGERVIWLEEHGRAVVDRAGKTTGLAGVVQNITERKVAEEATRRAHAKTEEGDRLLAALMEHVPVGITIADAPDVRIRMVSRAGRELTGKPRDVIEGISAGVHSEQWDLYRKDGVTRAHDDELPLTRATRRGEVVRGEVWVLGNPDGHRIPILCDAGPIRDAAGSITGGVVAWRDVSEIKRSEEAVQRSREGLKRLANASLSVMAKTDLGEMLQAVSEAALVLTGARIATSGHGYVSGQYVVGGSARVPDAPACPPGEMFLLDKGGVHMALAEGAESIRLTDTRSCARTRLGGGSRRDMSPCAGSSGHGCSRAAASPTE